GILQHESRLTPRELKLQRVKVQVHKGCLTRSPRPIGLVYNRGDSRRCWNRAYAVNLRVDECQAHSHTPPAYKNEPVAVESKGADGGDLPTRDKVEARRHVDELGLEEAEAYVLRPVCLEARFALAEARMDEGEVVTVPCRARVHAESDLAPVDADILKGG